MLCPFCHVAVRNVQTVDRENDPDWPENEADWRSLDACPTCGWWCMTRYSGFSHDCYATRYEEQCTGILRNLDVSDVSIPTVELSNYLTVCYNKRFEVHPKRFEDIVAGVFSDFGYSVRVTSYSYDRGIDVVILDGNNNDIVGIQVKRTRRKVGAEQIRSLNGALLLNNLTSGVFVTTSEFTRGAKRTADGYAQGGYPIELVDAEGFYDRLRISRRPFYTGFDDPDAPFRHICKSTTPWQTTYSEIDW